MTDQIAGMQIGNVALTVTDCGAGVLLTMSSRNAGQIEAALSADQCRRLRRLLTASEKRASRTPSEQEQGL